MIKVMAFDLIGVLVNEKDIKLTKEEEKIERLFGPNKSDEEFLLLAKKQIGEDKPIFEITKNIISKLYKVRQENVLEKVKEKYNDIKIVIATNHVTFIRKFIEENFNTKLIDDIIISAEINKIKPNIDFYEYMLEKYNIKPKELLFLDDNIKNIEGASKLGINVIKVERDMDLVDSINKTILK